MVIERLHEHLPPGRVGGKASHVGWLIANGEQVPSTWVVRSHLESGDVGELVAATLDPHDVYAVRSSANVEDGSVVSYAGQFVSELDVAAGDVAAAIERVRASIDSERVASYRDHVGGADGMAMTVIVQPMIPPVVSGVAFSRNPMTGLNEVVVEAVAGRGDRLVDDGVTPDRWIRRWGDWSEQPVDPVLNEEVVASIADGTARIAAAYGSPVDLEWVFDGVQVWWVQLRPITGLGDISVYSNRISREVMPGIIKPLVWSVNVPMVNRAWVDLFTEAIGPNDIKPENLAKAFAYRSYFNMGAIGDIFELLGMPRDSLELLLGLPSGTDRPSFKPTAATMRLLPRMVRLASGKARYGNGVPAEVRKLMGSYRTFDRDDLHSRSDSSLLSDIRALGDIGVRAAYANIVTPLLANLYNAVLRARLTKAGLDPESVDVAGTAELVDLNPNAHLDDLSEKVVELDDKTVAAMRAEGYQAVPDDLRGSVDGFLDRFGHLSASGNDFSVTPWRETPDVVVAMMLDHAEIRGATQRVDWGEAEQQLSPLARPGVRFLRRRTQEYVAHRESVSFAYTYGYGLFRRYFLEIGRRLAERGVLDESEDIMFLYVDEVRAALLGQPMDIAPAELVVARRAEIDAVRDVVMPEIIYGDDFVPSGLSGVESSVRGIPTSRGHHRGTLRVVRDTSEFGKVQPGDVIAIPYSDVGWTPLFARAGAVVAEAGGMLSHSSIVAREYQIPCVVSVPGATQLPDGAIVVVDGYAGTIEVQEPSDSGDTPSADLAELAGPDE